MFHKARLKLTVWYLLMIMFISLVFSIVIYANVDRELVRFEKFQQLSKDRAQDYFGYVPNTEIGNIVDQQLINEARGRLISDLILLNSCILLASSVAGFFLAGRTLFPIKKMIDDQSRFFGDASHELKTPITSLRSELEIYLRSKEKTLKDANYVIKSNLEEVTRIQNLIDYLLELAKMDATTTSMSFAKINLKRVIDIAITSVAAQGKQKDIVFLNKARKVSILGNMQSLTKLFIILFDNAIKYSPKNSSITVASSISNRQCFVEVSDQGIGILPEDLDHIFDRFYRADKSRVQESSPGYGLGLSMAKEIATLHGGEILVQSSPKGSTFTTNLPLS